MNDARRFGLPDLLLLLLVLGSAAGLRTWYLISDADYARRDPPVLVQDPSPELDLPGRPTEMQSLVGNIKTDSWFATLAPFADREETTAHASPGLPWLLGLLARFIPADRFDSSIRCLNAALGTLTAVLYFFFARRAFRSLPVAALAGLLCAAHPFWVVNTGLYDDGPLASFLLAFSLFLGARAVGTSGSFASLLYGLSLAGLSLVRAALLPFGFVALVWFLIRSRTLVRGWLCGLLAFLGFANGLAPWIVRNVQTFHEPIPIVDSLYLHLWIGNNPEATGGPVTPSMLASVPRETLQAGKDSPLPQPARYGKLAGAVVTEAKEHPAETIRRRILAGIYFLVGQRLVVAGRLVEGPVPTWLAVTFAAFSLLGMLLLAFLGWRWSFGWRSESMPAALALIWIPLPYILTHAESLHGPRLPLDGVLLTFAAFALCCLLPKIGWRLREAKPEPVEDW